MRVTAEGGSRFWQLTVEGKGSKRRRVALMNECARMLLQYRNLQEEYFSRRWKAPLRQHDPIFLVAPTRKLKDKTIVARVQSPRALQIGVSRLYKDARTKASASGLKLHLPHLHPHLLRHTMGTLMQRSRADVAEIQWQLGHSSPATTVQYYVARSIESLGRAVRKVEGNTRKAKAGNGLRHESDSSGTVKGARR